MSINKSFFDQLKASGIIGAEGKIFFELNGLKTEVRDSSIVGNVIQEWLKAFMQSKRIKYRVKDNSQDFPDFLMHESKDNIDLLEVKCFKKSPNFDIANFSAYSRSLLSYPYRLDSDYLIFEYRENEDSIEIKNIWLKKVWEICCGSERSPLKIQWKQGQPVNIRPATWYSKKTNYQIFNSRRDFVKSIKSLIDTTSHMNYLRKDWYNKVNSLYRKQTGREL